MQDFALLFKHYLNLAINYRWLALNVTALIAAIGVAAVFAWPERYEARARIFVDTQSILGPALKELAVSTNEEQELARLAKLIITRPNIERVIHLSDISMEARSSAEQEQLVESMIRDIEFRQLPGSAGVLQFGYLNRNPEKAKRVVQSLVSLFLETSLRVRRESLDGAVRFVDGQIAAMEKRLQASEEALKQFKIVNLGQMPNQAGDYFAQIAALEMQLRQSRLELLQAQSSRDAMRGPLAPSGAVVSGVPAPAHSEEFRLAERALAQARRQWSELGRRYTALHPDVIQAKQALDDAEAEFNRLARSEKSASPSVATGREPEASATPGARTLSLAVAELDAQIAASRVKIADLESRLASLKQQGAQIPRVEAELAQLNRDYESNRQQFDKLLAKRESLRVTSDVSGANGGLSYHLIDPPHVSARPVSPNRLLLLSLVALLAALGGGAAVFVRDRLYPRIIDAMSLRQASAVPILGAVSMILSPQERARARMNTLGFVSEAVVLGSVLGLAIAWQAWQLWGR